MDSKDQYHRALIASTYDNVDMPGGWSFNQVETLKMIDRLYNSKFKSGQYDQDGYRKFFYNIVKPPCDIATKFVDLDTRDILLTPEHSNDELRVFLMQRRLKQWLKDSNFGKLLNDITNEWPVRGHFVIKKSKDGWKLVPLQNLRNNPAADGIVTDDFAELYVLTLKDMRDLKWDVSKIPSPQEGEEYIVYDCFSRTEKGWNRQVKVDLWTRSVSGGGLNRSVESELNEHTDYSGSTVVFEADMKKHNYRELKWEHVPGRAMGRGFVEYLEDNQIARNETENLERKSHAFHSTPLLQTRDEDIAGKNILINYKPGDIVRANSEVTPIAVEARNLPQFKETRENWDMNTERKTFTSDITTGASLPSRTPLGVANLQASLATSFFERKREDLGLFIKQLLLEDIIPSFASDTVKEHVMVFSCADDEATYLDDAITETMVGQSVVDYVNKTGWWPSAEEKQLLRLQVKDKLKGKKNRYLRIPDGFWKDAHYLVDVNITGESSDVSVKSQILQLALQIIGTNPGVTQDPVMRQVFFKFLGLGGINPTEVGLVAQPQQYQDPNQPQVAGSLAKPTAPVQGQFKVTQQL